VLGDTPKPQCRPRTAAGSLTLGLGDDAGTTILGEAQDGETQSLALALAQARRELDTPPTRVEYDAERASGAMHKVQDVLDHFTEIAEGRIGVDTLGSWADGLFDSLKGLDPDGHWQERLRVLRTLAVLLALLERWLDLAQSLTDALQAAERLGDDGARAWVMHELGTLHLAAEQHAEADDYLSQALQLRAGAKDLQGVKATEANLQVLCKMLRLKLHETALDGGQPPPKPTNGESTQGVVAWLSRRPLLLLLVLGLVLLAVGGVAGAVIFGKRNVKVRRDHHGATAGEATRTVIVRPRISPLGPGSPSASFSFAPSPALAGRIVSFDASDSSDPDPRATIVDYLWRFGDGQTQAGIDPTHAYAKAGTYAVELIVADTRGASSRTTHTIVVDKQTNELTSRAVEPERTSTTPAQPPTSYFIPHRGA
jgi:hypothetical protein